MSFPDPNQSTTHSIGNKTWNWDGKKWVAEPMGNDVPNLSGKRDEGMVGVLTADTFTLKYDPDAMQELGYGGVSPAPTIGNVVISGNLNPTVGDTVTYSYIITGNAQNTTGNMIDVL